MKINNFISSLLILLVVLLSGCASQTSSKGDGLSELKKRGYVILGFDDTFVPMGFKDKAGQVVGFDIDIAKEVFKRANLEVKFQPIDWSMKEAELNSKNIDLIWNGYTITDERKEKVAFSKPYLKNRQVIIVISNSSVKTKKDLAGKSISAQNGSSSVDALNKDTELLKSLKGRAPVLFETNNDALMDLEARRVDAVVADEILARYYMKERGTEKYRVLGEDLGSEEYGIGMRKDDKALIELVDKALDDMRGDGSLAKISEKWFGENIVK